MKRILRNTHYQVLLIFILSFLTSSIISAETTKIQFSEFDLNNGLHVILHQDNSVPIVSISILYHVGSKNEPPHKTGFAHFFEHLMFEGTENIERGEYSKYIENAGGTLNAYTTVDKTYYYEILPSNQLELGLWLESERMLHAKVDSIGIRTQKRVVIEEKKQRYDNRPYGTIFQEIFKRAFHVHPYRWTTIGDPTHIMQSKDEDFVTFYKTFYVPNNATLVIAGDIDPKQAKDWIEKYFADIPKGTNEIARPSENEPELTSEIRDTIFDNVQVPLILQAYRTPPMNSEDYYAIDMLSTLLSNGKSSRLHKALVEKQQTAMEVGLFPMPYVDPSIAISYAFPNMNIDCKDVEEQMDVEIARVRDELISEKEFQKLKNQYENQIINGYEKIATRAEALANYYTFFGNSDLINQELDKYMAVTREDIKRVANKYFIPSNRVVLYYLPKSMQK